MTTTNTESSATPDSAPSAPAQNAKISASTYRAMLNVLNDLVDHNHYWTDTFSTNCQCQCQCQCACTRGNL